MGVSSRQLWNMKKFYERYAGHDEKVQRSVALLPWSHNNQLFAAKYMTYMPTEEELRNEIEQQKRFFMEQHGSRNL